MSTLDRRIEALERKTGGADGPLMILISIVSPGHVGAPRVRAECDGLTFERTPCEQEDEFIGRVKAELLATMPQRSAYQVMLFGSEAQTDHG